jgi:hypothetical protein
MSTLQNEHISLSSSIDLGKQISKKPPFYGQKVDKDHPQYKKNLYSAMTLRVLKQQQEDKAALNHPQRESHK